QTPRSAHHSRAQSVRDMLSPSVLSGLFLPVVRVAVSRHRQPLVGSHFVSAAAQRQEVDRTVTEDEVRPIAGVAAAEGGLAPIAAPRLVRYFFGRRVDGEGGVSQAILARVEIVPQPAA